MLSTKIVIAFALSGTLAGVTVIVPSAGAGASANGGVRASAAAGVQVIDANTDPAGAGKVLNDFCDPASKCQFAGSVQPKVAYDEPRTIGDALYNCGSSYAEDSVEISDERSQSTSLEESLSTKVTLGILTSELEATTKQLQKVSTTTGATQEVSVAPGWKGWVTTQVPTASVTGDLTDNSNFKVINFSLSYPGYGDDAIHQIYWTSVHERFSTNPSDQHTYCDQLPPVTVPGAALGSGGSGSPALHLCRMTRSASPRRAARNTARRCTTRRLTAHATLPLTATKELARLARGRVLYATGTASTTTGIDLVARRKIARRAYMLLLTGRDGTVMLPVTIH